MNQKIQIPEPAVAKFLFADTRIAWLWFIIRLYIGWQWLSAGIEKLQGSAWVGSGAGSALKGFLLGALGKAQGTHPDVQGWYASFIQGFVIQHVSFFSYLVTYGELLVGVALIIGACTGIAAFFGAFMNMNYLLAGTVSINPVLLIGGLFLILAWRVAGWYGVDHYLLRLLGTPWQKGALFKE